MSKTTLGQKSLSLSACLLLSTGLVLSFTQAIDERGTAGKSQAELRQQAWTQDIIAGKATTLRGSETDILAYQATATELITGSIATGFSKDNPQPTAPNHAVVKVARVSKSSPLDSSASKGAFLLPDRDGSAMTVNRAVKSDRRLEWRWEPFQVAHGRRDIALNWSGSVWSMAGAFERTSHKDLPKLTFAPSDDLELVMADASQFLLPEPIGLAPDVMLAQNKEQPPAPAGQSPAAIKGNEGTALAYAPNSTEALEAPFNAILTEHRKGRISEDNQVTILGAVEALNAELDGGQAPAAVKPEKVTRAIAAITALPRARAPRANSKALAKVSEPLDVNPVVTALEKKHEAQQTANAAASVKKEGLTLAKSKAVRADLQLASLSGDKTIKKKKKSPFASWFNFSKQKKVAKIDARGEHAWVTNKLPKSSFSKKQRTCLANAIYFESRSEPINGQIAVAQVVVNRVKNPTYPNSICGVVYQNQHRRNACQFSFACDRIPDRIRSKKAWETATKLANQVIDGEVWLKSIGSSTHYHATYVRPRWARTMKRLTKIGLHIFYKTYGGGWS